MKKILIGILFLQSFVGYSQLMKFRHILTQDRLDRLGFVIKQDSNILKIQDGQWLKCALSLDGKGSISMDVWSIDSTSDNSKGSKSIINSKTTSKGLLITDNRLKIGDPVKVLWVPFRAISLNLATIPVRYRPKTDSSSSAFSGNFSISVSPGYTLGSSQLTARSANHYSITVGPFVGFSTIDIKKETVKRPKTWDRDKIPAQTTLAFSYGGSVTLSRNGFGIVGSIGFDHAMGPDQDLWSYQDKMWLGLGVTTSFTSPK